MTAPGPVTGGGRREPSVDLVALDVDGTVLTPDHRITPATKAAVDAARDRGVRIVLASSRGPVALAAIQQELGLAQEWFIGYQGALVARRERGGLEVLAEHPLDPAAAGEVEELAVALGLSVGRYTGVRWQVPRLTDAIRAEAAITGETPVVGTREQRDGHGAPHKVLAIADVDDRIPALHRLADGVPSGVASAFSHRNYLEMTATGVDKASGLRPLLAHLAVPPGRTAAVGDGLNDLALFGAVGCPVAMGHAAPAVRAAAAWVTGTNGQDGVAHALARLGAAPPVERAAPPTA